METIDDADVEEVTKMYSDVEYILKRERLMIDPREKTGFIDDISKCRQA